MTKTRFCSGVYKAILDSSIITLEAELNPISATEPEGQEREGRLFPLQVGSPDLYPLVFWKTVGVKRT